MKVHYLNTNTRSNGNSLDMMLEKIKKEISNNNSIQLETIKNETKSETIAEPTEHRNIFTVVEQMAEFPGGSFEMMKFIQKNIQYPAKAKEESLSGKCFTKFIVEPSGEISEIFILKGVPGCKECDEEAIRVIKAMPKWKPGKQGNKFVPVYFNLPINFQLR